MRKTQKLDEKKVLLENWCKNTVSKPEEFEKEYNFALIERVVGLSSACICHSEELQNILIEYKIKTFKPNTQSFNEKKELLENWCKNITKEHEELKKEYSFGELERLAELTQGSISKSEELRDILSEYKIKIMQKQSLDEKKVLLEIWCNNIVNKPEEFEKEYSYTEINKLSGLTASSITSSKKLQNILSEYKIKIFKLRTANEKKVLLEDWCKNIIVKPEEFKEEYTYSEIERSAELTQGDLRRSEELQDILTEYKIKTFKPNTQSFNEKKELLENWCKNIEKKPENFKKEYSYREIDKLASLAQGSIKGSKELQNILTIHKIKIIKKQSPDEKKVLLENWCNNIVNKPEEFKKEYTYSEIERSTSLIERSIKHSKELQNILSEYKIKIIKKQRHDEKKVLLENWCNNIVNKPEEFKKEYTYSEIERSIGLAESSIKHSEKLKEVLVEYKINLLYNTSHKLSSNWLYFLGIAKTKTYNFLNIDSFIEYVKDLYNIELKMLENDVVEYIYSTHSFFANAQEFETDKIVEDIIFQLIQVEEVSVNEILLNEIKLHILSKYKIYINESSILDSLLNLSNLNIAVDAILQDNIQKRLRYAQLLASSNIVEIDYVEKLPQLNNSDGSIILLNSIRNKKKFLKLWKQYAQFLINNELQGNVDASRKQKEHKGSLDSLVEKHPEYLNIFFLDKKNVKALVELSYEGIAALAFTAMNKQSHDNEKRMLQKHFHSTNARCAGFFMWLNKKGLALSHPKFVNIFGGTKIVSIIDKLSTGNKFKDVYEAALEKKVYKNEEGGEKKDKARVATLTKAKGHLAYMYFSLAPNFDPMTITSEEFDNYFLSASMYSKPTGTINLKGFLELTFGQLGNNCAFVSKEDELIEVFYDKIILSKNLSNETLKNYNTLFNESKQILIDRIENDHIEYKTMKTTARQFSYLFSFLDTLRKRCSRNEMINILNPNSKSEIDFKTFILNTESTSKYYMMGSNMALLFSRTKDMEYINIYDNGWNIQNKYEKKVKLIRAGMEETTYEILQKLAFYEPCSHSLPFIKTAFNGEHIDTSWWKHNFSPILPLALWLTTKLPRRGKHILQLDVERFLQYDNTVGIDGEVHKELSGFYFNTDKNVNIHDTERDTIKIELLKRIFTDDELTLIEKYVKYIKDAYGHLPAVNHKISKKWQKIKPLFPNERNILSKDRLDTYYNKTLVYAQLRIKDLASNSPAVFRKFYNKDILDTSIERLKNCTLIYEKEVKGQLIKRMPVNLKEMKDFKYSDSDYTKYFTCSKETEDGVKISNGLHNLRGAGATYLLRTLGFNLEEITEITGHVNEKVLTDVYMKLTSKELFNELNRVSKDLGIMTQGVKEIKSGSLVMFGTNFINNVLAPILNQNKDIVESIHQKLLDNAYMSKDATIISNDKELFNKTGEILVENGLEIASRLSPISYWDVRYYGICTMKNCCPQGTAGICSKCPLLIFSPMHIEGVIAKLDQVQSNMLYLQNLVSIAFKNGDRQNRNELKKDFEIAYEEFIGWWEILHLINEKFKEEKNTNNLPRTVSESILITEQSNIHQLQMSILSAAKEMNISNLTTDRAKLEVSNKLLHNMLVRGQNDEALKIIQQDGIDLFIERYQNLDREEKSIFVEEYLNIIDDSKHEIAIEKKVLGFNLQDNSNIAS